MNNNIRWYKIKVVEELQNSLTNRIKVDTVYNGSNDSFTVILTDDKTGDIFKTKFERFTEELWVGLELKTIVRVTLSRYKGFIQKLYIK